MVPMNKPSEKQRPLGELRELARKLTREALADYELPQELRAELILGTFFEGNHRIFELYRPGPRPEDAQVISRVLIDAVTGEAGPVEICWLRKLI